MNIIKHFNNLKCGTSNIIRELSYSANKAIRHATYPIRNQIYLNKNGFDMDATWECGSSILKETCDYCQKISFKDTNILESYLNFMNSDIFLMVDNIPADEELKCYEKSRKKFLKVWNSLADSIIENKDELNINFLNRIYKLLSVYNDECFSYPPFHEKEKYHMIDNIDKFAKQNVSFIISLNKDAKNKDGTIKTNEEYGLSYALFIEDIYHVCNVIQNYIEWNDTKGTKGNISLRDSFNNLDKKEAEELDDHINEAFKKAWNWIGYYLRTLWK